MPRYVIAQPLGDDKASSDESTLFAINQQLVEPLGRVSMAAMGAALPETEDRVPTDDPAATVIVDCPVPEMHRRRARLPASTIVEEECARWPALFRPAASLRGMPSLPAGVGAAIDVTLAGDAMAVDGGLGAAVPDILARSSRDICQRPHRSQREDFPSVRRVELDACVAVGRA